MHHALQSGQWHWFNHLDTKIPPARQWHWFNYLNASSQAARSVTLNWTFKCLQPAKPWTEYLIPAQSSHKKKTSIAIVVVLVLIEWPLWFIIDKSLIGVVNRKSYQQFNSPDKEFIPILGTKCWRTLDRRQPDHSSWSPSPGPWWPSYHPWKAATPPGQGSLWSVPNFQTSGLLNNLSAVPISKQPWK